MPKLIAEKSLFLITIGLLFLPACAEETQSAQAENQADAALHRTSVKAEPQATKQVTKKVEDLPNFHQVHPYLYRGGEPTLKGLEQLQAIGVKTIIDLRAPSEMKFAEPQAAKKLGFNYINLPMSSKAPTDKQIKTLMQKIDEAKAKYEQGQTNKAESDKAEPSKAAKDGAKPESVFVHCAHGSDRTGSMVGIWRVSRDNYDYDQAYREMRKYYFGPKFVELSGAVRNACESSSKGNVISKQSK